jgi:uncharacterized hydrophobic protein (TIGR00271 family)
VITVRVRCPAELSPRVQEALAGVATASAVAVYRGAGLIPAGDVFEADIPRSSANEVIDRLIGIGVAREGSIELIPVGTYVSRPGLAAEERAGIDSEDTVVWSEVIERAYGESRVTWNFLAFMVLATLLAAVAILTDSVILVVGAMVLGPEFVAVASLGIGLVRRRPHLLRQALRTLAIGFAVAIALTAVVALAARLGGVPGVVRLAPDLRPATAFIYDPNGWSLLVAVVAGAAGVLALTSRKSDALVGVFISVTTIPAAGGIALALAFTQWPLVWGGVLTLVVNLTGLALAGWATLALQQWVLSRSRARRARRQPALR